MNCIETSSLYTCYFSILKLFVLSAFVIQEEPTYSAIDDHKEFMQVNNMIFNKKFMQVNNTIFKIKIFLALMAFAYVAALGFCDNIVEK
jgi:hypothetical protein